MFDKFGEMDSFGEINELAENLFNEGDTASIKTMAKENGIDKEYVEMYLSGDIPVLCDAMTAALGKIDVEVADLKPKEIMEDWMELQSRNILQDAVDLDRVKKFCNAPHQYNEKKWWGYIAAHERDIVSTARRKTERRKYEKRKKALDDRNAHTDPLPEKRNSGYSRQPLLSKRTLPVLQKAWWSGKSSMQ